MAGDAAGDVFIADAVNNRVVEVKPGGSQVNVGSGFSKPAGVAVDAAGDLFIADFGNNRVLEVKPGVPVTVTPAVVATVSGTVGVSWGTSGTATLQTNADGLRLLPGGRNTDLPWLGINKLTIALSQSQTLLPGDIKVTGVNLASYAFTVSGSGTSYTITLLTPINAADRVTVTIGNANITTFTRRLDVLPGDFNDDGVVNSADLVGVRNQYLGIAGAVPTIFGDINGDGVVDVNDYSAVRKLVGTRLP